MNPEKMTPSVLRLLRLKAIAAGLSITRADPRSPQTMTVAQYREVPLEHH